MGDLPHILNEKIIFPPVEDTLPDGLLAIGGDLSTERLLLAYKRGIFPWYDEGLPLWWCPNPRFVLYPNQLHISKTMRQLLRKNVFEFKVNTSFTEVITACKTMTRKEQDGTWINNDIVAAYTKLHEAGYVHCAETWYNGELVGGLYGVRLGNVFFGESMFSSMSNASKFAFVKYVQQLADEGVVLIDCQVYTEHLESLGATMIPRKEFIAILNANI